MTIDEAIKEMLRSAEMNRHMAERCRYANSMQPSLYDVEAGVQYSNAAEKYHQIAKWLEELKRRRDADKDLIGSGALNNEYEQGYNKAIEDCASVVVDLLPCNDCLIDCGVHSIDSCEKAIIAYLRENLEGGKENAGKS